MPAGQTVTSTPDLKPSEEAFANSDLRPCAAAVALGKMNREPGEMTRRQNRLAVVQDSKHRA